MQWDVTDGGGLFTLEAITPADVTTQVWHRTNETPSLSALDQRCHPPAAALTR